MNKSNKVKSINKRLEMVFKDLETMSFEDINKILFNVDILKNKYLHKNKQGKTESYKIKIRDIIKKIEQ